MAIRQTTVSQTYPRFQSLVFPTVTPTLATLTTAGGARTITAAELLGGLLILNVDDAQTATLPTADLLYAALASLGVGVGTAFDFDVINTGDTTLTVEVGTGGTAATGSNSKSSVLTVVANASKRFTVIFTSVQAADGSGSNAYRLIGYGSIAAAVA